jgi:hypothetical protein
MSASHALLHNLTWETRRPSGWFNKNNVACTWRMVSRIWRGCYKGGPVALALRPLKRSGRALQCSTATYTSVHRYR